MSIAGPTPNALPSATSNVTTSGGSANALPLWTTATNIQSSALTQTGSGSTAKIGIRTTTPTATFDVKGDSTIEGLLSLPATGEATAAGGRNSQSQDFVASAFNSNTNAAVSQTFQWRAEPTGNNTSSPAGAMHLLFGSGPSSPAETGLKISNTGVFTFAAGQTFPGAGTLTGIKTVTGSGLTGGGSSGTLTLGLTTSCATNQLLQWNGTTWKCSSAGTGTITGVTTVSGSGLTGGGVSGTLSLGLTRSCGTNQVLQWNGSNWVCSSAGSGTVTSVNSGAGLTGGPITGNGTLGIATGGVSNAMLPNSSFTLAAGTGLTGGGSIPLGGATTLNLDPTKVPLLSANNTFVGNQTITGSLTASGAVSGLLANFGGNTSVGLQSITFNSAGVGIFGYAIGANTGGTGVFGESDQASGIGVLANGATGVSGVATVCCTGPGGRFTGSSSHGQNAHGTPGVTATGGNADQSGPYSGGDGLVAQGGNGGGCDAYYFNCGSGGAGVRATGGSGQAGGINAPFGPGGAFFGPNSGNCGGTGCGGDGIDAYAGIGVEDLLDGFAAYFEGDVLITGTMSAGAKDFNIDHPLDPANRYLAHASIESSEMMNVYSGNLTTDAQGEATVQLTDWFEALNRDFRYQLTVIGQFAQAIIARKIENHQFTIQTNAPNVEVSWQVTGVRQDAYAKAHPPVVEEEEPAPLKGFLVSPRTARRAAREATRVGAPSTIDEKGEGGEGQSGRAHRCGKGRFALKGMEELRWQRNNN
jgi:hypothetical protein